MDAATTKLRNLRRRNSRAARKHLIYTSEDVLRLYEIAPNTLTGWINYGLPFTRSTCNLFLGQDLNAFQEWFRKKNRRPLAMGEAYCVHCKDVHSAHDNEWRIQQNTSEYRYLLVACHQTGKDAYKIVSKGEIDAIDRAINRKNRDEKGHCNVVGLGSKTAIFPSNGATHLNAANLALRYDYQIHLKQAAGFAETTILAALRHIAKFEAFVEYADYKSTHRDAVIRFKEGLESQHSASVAQLSASTIVHALLDLKAFFAWLSQRPGQKSISPDIAALFTPSKAMMSLAATSDERFIPSLDEVRTMIHAMPSTSFIERRDRAIMAFLLLSGVRISALLSLQLQHIDVESRIVFQDARVVKTKNRKTMRTAWFPVGENIETVFVDWIQYYREQGATDRSPLFPRALDPIRLIYSNTHLEPLADQGKVRAIIKAASAHIGIPYFNPHNIRKTLALYGDTVARTQKQKKAWSQNLGHRHIATTENYYGKLDLKEQIETMNDIRATSARTDTIELLQIVQSLAADQVNVLTIMAKALAEKQR